MSDNASSSPPGLISSSSTSQPSSSHLSPPRTPPPHSRPRGRQNARYPSGLAKGVDPARVPLHRRGTSRTYERLEDLLREAGYKETRIVTPQSDRYKGDDADDTNVKGTEQSKSGGVIRFLSTLLNSQAVAPIEGRASSSKREAWSVPTSPLPKRQPLPPDPSQSALYSETSSVSSYRSRSRPTQQQPTSSVHDRTQHTHKAIHHRLPPERSLRSQESLVTYSEASRARTHLRHMASAPSISRIRTVTRPHVRGSIRSARRAATDSSNRDSPPPLPVTWLESVTRALLGAPGTHVGGPDVPESASTVSASTSGESTIRPTQSFASVTSWREISAPTSTSEDQPISRGRGRPSGALLSNAQLATANVVHVRVVCRSAPASRAGSRVRREVSLADLGNVHERRNGQGKSKPKKRCVIKRDAKKNGPSLTGHVEDGWWEADAESEIDTEEEEGEVDLTKLLVSPKRQMSIQSLRRHLGSSTRSRHHLPARVGATDEGDVMSIMSDGERMSQAVGGSMGRRHRRTLPRVWEPEEQ